MYSLTILGIERKIPVPVPLKHHTETALLLLLGLVIAGAGFTASLLPHFAAGVLYWLVCFVVSVLYPLTLRRTFRESRVDYELRFLHWFPASIFLLWLLLELTAPHLKIALILELGFFTLWSLQLVFLGILFIILFCIHVIRRSTPRVTLLSSVLVLCAALSIVAEAEDWHGRLQRTVFPQTALSLKLAAGYARLTSGSLLYPVSNLFAGVNGDVETAASSAASSLSHSSPLTGDQRGRMNKRLHRLPRSGSETEAGAVLLIALYCSVVHIRARKRLQTAEVR